MSPWLYLLVSVVGGGILLGLGLVKARPVSQAAGFLFAAAGLVIPLSSCCAIGPGVAEVELADPEAVFLLSTAMAAFGDLLAMILIAVAFVLLGRARSAK